jgi:CubicO group peptidase (beta-lactamase class C family)
MTTVKHEDLHMTAKTLSKQRLERLHHSLAGYVQRGEIPGLVALVSCRDDVHIETLGTMALDRPAPMQRDTIFRMASLTKPVTAVAAMILVEECRLRLDDPVEEWLPELAKRRVLRSIASQPDDTIPARRGITVRDLLTFRMGFGSVLAAPDTYPIQRLIRELQIGGDSPRLPSKAPPGDEWLRRLGSLPWMAHPGDRWLYHVSADVLGMLIARVSGQSLGAFMHERIFEPLGMKDTAFRVPSGKIERLAASYRFNQAEQALELFDDPAISAWGQAPDFETGGSGLVSTVDDYWAFARMMLNKGRCRGGRILSSASVELMTSDQLTPQQREGAEVFFDTHRSWGFGMAVDTKQDELFRTPGRFGWDGVLGTSAYVDPVKQVIGILFTQRMLDSAAPSYVITDFWTLAYGALES